MSSASSTQRGAHRGPRATAVFPLLTVAAVLGFTLWVMAGTAPEDGKSSGLSALLKSKQMKLVVVLAFVGTLSFVGGFALRDHLGWRSLRRRRARRQGGRMG